MIYLIDDNKKRQQDSGWGEDKFEEYKEFIQPIYRLSEVNDDIRNELFIHQNNVILFHESFFENFENKQVNDVNDIRNKLEKLSTTSLNRYYVTFSGSNSERKLNENFKSASIPVYILYNNLEIFIQQFQFRNEYNLKYLLYGANPEIEPFLLKELNNSKRQFIEENLNISNELDDYFFFRSKLDINPLNKNHATIFNKDSQLGLNDLIYKNLSSIEYKGIFVPLCFGSSLSDFNGLRLAAEIRCTNNLNRTTPIYIYSFIGIENLIQNEYFNILKTKNIKLIEYSKQAFKSASSLNLLPLKTNELAKEIKKLELQTPKNYIDNHSILNEWAINQWAKTIGCDETEELIKVFQNVESNLYFKYLNTINPISKLDRISSEKLKIKYEGKPKVLLIDDEAEKGWNEIFAFLLSDLNNIYTDFLAIDFKKSSSNEIIEKSIDKIFNDDIDIVILDFRLNPSDFDNKNSKEITSIKLLKKIKERNPGVQVIAFSATNKIWNLQALQSANADAFIFKDSSENIYQSIDGLKENLYLCIKKALILKNIYKTFERIKFNAINLSSSFKNSLEKNLSICFELLVKSFQNSKYRNYAYLQLFLIVEEFIKEESIFEFGINAYVLTPKNRYLVYSKNNPTQRNSSAKSAIKFLDDNGHYHIEHSIYNNRNVDTNFIMSAILLFRNGLKTSGGENWSKIYKIRNKKAAHPELSIVEFSEITLLAGFLKYILDETKLNPVPATLALKELSQKEQVENLKKIWGAN